MKKALRNVIRYALINAEDIGALIMGLVLGFGGYVLMCMIIIAGS